MFEKKITLNVNRKNYSDTEKKSKYSIMKDTYLDYINKIEKTDFCNSLTRLQVEYNLLQQVHYEAKKENKEDEFSFIQERFLILSKKFEEYGLKIKNFI